MFVRRHKASDYQLLLGPSLQRSRICAWSAEAHHNSPGAAQSKMEVSIAPAGAPEKQQKAAVSLMQTS